jgi:thiol-disulfide isomerase/thioredoxin
MAPALELTDLQGQRLRLADYKGRIVLLNFWATWCPPCRTEIPELVKWQQEYGGRGLQVIGITYPPQTRSEVGRFARKTKMNYPIALGTKANKALFTSSEALPVTVVIDTEGRVHGVIEGIVFADEFDAQIKPLLFKQQGTVTTRQPKPKRRRVQKATIIVNSEGYKPKNLRLRRGVSARLTFIRKAPEGCGTEIVIPAYGVNRPLPLNVPIVVSFTPTRSGRFKLTCGMDMFRGSLVVR